MRSLMPCQRSVHAPRKTPGSSSDDLSSIRKLRSALGYKGSPNTRCPSTGAATTATHELVAGSHVSGARPQEPFAEGRGKLRIRFAALDTSRYALCASFKSVTFAG